MTKCLGLYVQHLFCNTVKGMNLLTFQGNAKKKNGKMTTVLEQQVFIMVNKFKL